MEEKILELMMKMYNEVQQLNSRFDGLEAKVDAIQQNQVKMEHTMTEKFRELFDGYTQNTESINDLKETVNKLTENLEKTETEVRVIHYNSKP